MWLSDSPIQEEHAESVLADQGNVEVVSYYEKFVRTAMEVRDKVASGESISPSPILADLRDVLGRGRAITRA